MSKKDKPNCYECEHRGEVGGSAHTKCLHPKTGVARENPMLEMMGTFLARGVSIQADVGLNVKGDEYGVSQGWFSWPYNFDPVWLESCDGFEEKESQ